MKCPSCQTELPDSARFCMACGRTLQTELVCTQCKHANPPAANFCLQCGQSLTQSVAQPPFSPSLTFGEKIAKVQHYLPKDLAEKILAQRERIEGERKQVTVLFTDMAGYTSMSEKLDPEEAFGLMEQVYEILIRTVNEYGGTVNELKGDGVMALFGAPIALEDAPQRAIRASLSIHRELVQFNEKMRREKAGLPVLRMRAGINTGPVVMGTLGNDLRVEFKVAGDTVNLASRMEALAEPGSTYVTENTFKLAEGLFRFEGLGEKEIKGKEKPIRIYRVIAPSTSRTRFDVSAERGLTPFVGRERERELLLDAFERARAGRGQAVSIISEAGMGKSRLLYEFRKAVLNEDITFLEGKCLSFSRGVAYQPIADILKSNFDIRDGDLDLVVRNKVKQGLKTMAVEEGPTLPYILELLSVQDSGIEQIAISPEGKKDKTIETIKKLILMGSQQRPLVIAIEDLHWIDKTSEEVFKYLLESIAGARVLLILTYRPEFIPTWGARSYHNQLLLNRLSNRESLFMATHILDTDDLETALEEVILEKTEGIPFFVEEFIKSMKDLGFIERKDSTYRISKELQTIRIPSTIQDIIMARVDALPEGAKELLQVGSLIEREFSYKLIKAAMHLPEEDLLRRLSILKDAELLYERGLFPDSTFVFKHALTREVVYDTLLERKKKELHIDIGQAIEEVYKDNPEEQYGALAEHFEQGGGYEKAAQYFLLAQEHSQNTSSYSEAIAFSRKAVECLEKLPQTVEVQKQVIDARIALAYSCMRLDHIAEARDAVDPVFDLALHLDYRKSLPTIYVTMAAYLYTTEEKFGDKARRYLMEAQRLALEEKDYQSLVYAYLHEGIGHLYDSEFAEAEPCYLRIMEIAEASGNVPMLVAAKYGLGGTYGYEGRIEEALRCCQEALQLALKADDLYLQGYAYCACGTAFYRKGFFPDAEENLKQAIEINQKIDFTQMLINSFSTLISLHHEMGRYQEAQKCCDSILTVLEHSGTLPSASRMTNIRKVATEVRGGLDPALDEVLTFNLQEIGLKGFKGAAARLMGEIYLYCDDRHLDEAEVWIRKALDIQEQIRTPLELAWSYALYAEFFKKKGDLELSKENRQKAIDLMRSCGADGWVKKYEEEMAGL